MKYTTIIKRDGEYQVWFKEDIPFDDDYRTYFTDQKWDALETQKLMESEAKSIAHYNKNRCQPRSAKCVDTCLAYTARQA
jgi:hypothetical protein